MSADATRTPGKPRRERATQTPTGVPGPGAVHALLTFSVGLLTQHSRGPASAMVVALFFWATASDAVAQSSGTHDWQPIEDIKAAAEDYLHGTVGKGDARVVPKAGHLDARLQLPRCTVPLAPYTQPGSKTTGRLIVGVRCQGRRPWNVYVPVDVAVMEDVLVTARSLARGHVLGREDVEVVRRDVARLIGGYTTDPAAVAGQRLKRSVPPGTVLTSNHLQPAILIERGQTVTLTIRSDSLDISMSGKALMDGVENQRIRVQNTGSGRVVEGLVRSPELVEVIVN